jgi:hypothetical protein
MAGSVTNPTDPDDGVLRLLDGAKIACYAPNRDIRANGTKIRVRLVVQYSIDRE